MYKKFVNVISIILLLYLLLLPFPRKDLNNCKWLVKSIKVGKNVFYSIIEVRLKREVIYQRHT